jgi:hypothetical protein
MECRLSMNSAANVPFALLQHVGHGPEHYDLLLQLPGQSDLLTWRITLPPEKWKSAGAIDAIRLPDHRPLYLTYEGPISNNRGHVKQLAAGAATVLEQTDTMLRLQLPGPLSCTLSLPLI